MKTLMRKTRLASVILPAFLYLGCTGEGLTGPTASNDGDNAAESGVGEAVPDGSAAAGRCIQWKGKPSCPSTADADGLPEAK